MVDSSNRILVYDIEANGLLDTVTKIWCIYAKDMETNECFLFHEHPEFDEVEGLDDLGKPYKLPKRTGNIKQGVIFIHKAKCRIAHNCLSYDERLMKKFFPKFNLRYKYGEVRDTLLESQVQWFDRPPVKGYKGVHGLATYGARFGIRKPEIMDWSYIDADKLNRCIQDVDINEQVARFLEREREHIKEQTGLTFEEALKIEHEYRYRCSDQELNGALVDKPHMESCVVELDGLIEDLRKEIEPELPPTMKIKGGKVTKKDLFDSLGLDSSKIVVQYESRERNGVVKEYPIKDWAKAVTKWSVSKKVKKYAIVLDKEQKTGYTFEKLKEAREYALENFGKNKFKYPYEEVELTNLDSHTKRHLEGCKYDYEIVGSFTKIVFEPSKMSQHERVKELLVGLGWKPDEWTFKTDETGSFIRAEVRGEINWPAYKVNGNQLSVKYKKGERIPLTPKITEKSFDSIPEGLGKKISEYNTYSHRRKFIQNPTQGDKDLINLIRDDGRLTCGLMSFGTTAGRA